ncbi:MAG: Fe-S cluster assembly protein SufD [Alphaproteobacteria bacterium]
MKLAEAANITAPYVSRFGEIAATLPGGAQPWLAELRADAIHSFAETGFPTIRTEAWKYTDLRRMLRTEFTAAAQTPAPQADALERWRLICKHHRLVFVDGQFSPALSDLSALPPGVRLVSLDEAADGAPDLLQARLGATATDAGDGLVALNTAFMAGGAVLQLDDGVVLDAPVHLLFLAAGEIAGAVSHPRNMIVLGAASQASIIETFAGADGTAYWSNPVSDITLAEGARLNHVKLQAEGADGYHTALTRIGVARDAAYRGMVMSAGARMARNEIRVRLDGRGASCAIDGATLLRGRQHADNTTEIIHAATDGTSRQVFKGVLDGSSRAVFQGRVRVEPGAQRTNADQLNRNLLLSPGAEADSKPELVIHADDVKCSHGATTGDLDQDALFYLRARGISEASARALLIEAFIGELIEGMPVAAARSSMFACLDDWLGVASVEREAP